jgi:hypothetical protein
MFTHASIFPTALSLGSGKFALDLGLNVWGLTLCTAGYLVGALLAPRMEVTSPSTTLRACRPL